MPAPELVIFDCDGVLVDSEIVAARVEAQLLSAAGFEITPEELAARYSGLTFKDILLTIEREAEMLFQASLLREAEAMVDKRLRAEARAIDGAHQAVASVEARKCVCSNSSAERIAAMLERTRLKALFGENIFSALDTEGAKTKPAPDVFLLAAEKMGVAARNAIVIEDSVHGVSGARAAGMRVIGFTGASHTHAGHADLLTEAGAETVIARWTDFPPMLAALSDWSADM